MQICTAPGPGVMRLLLQHMGYKEVLMDLMNTVMDMAGIYFTTILRWIFMILALFILAR